MSESRSVSVVMPCYNGMPYLPEALDSALAQTHRPYEIIVVDDGSSDASADTVRQYIEDWGEELAGGIHLVQQANAGEPAARNAGIRRAKGEWVAALDTDDWWDPTKLAKQVDRAEAVGDDCVLVHTGYVYHYPDGRSETKDMTGPAQRVGRCTRQLLEPSSIGHPSITVRRSALEQIGGYDESFVQACDIELYFRLSAIGSFACVPEPLLHYRIHAKQMSASQVKQVSYHHRAVRKFFKEHPEFEQQIGREQIEAALAEHVAVKLESQYWRRNLAGFRELLAFADEQGLESSTIENWRRKARWPDWLIRLKDKLTGGGSAA